MTMPSGPDMTMLALLALAGAVIAWCAMSALNTMGPEANGWTKTWWCVTGFSGFWAVLLPFSDSRPATMPWPLVALVWSLAIFCWRATHRTASPGDV